MLLDHIESDIVQRGFSRWSYTGVCQGRIRPCLSHVIHALLLCLSHMLYVCCLFSSFVLLYSDLMVASLVCWLDAWPCLSSSSCTSCGCILVLSLLSPCVFLPVSPWNLLLRNLLKLSLEPFAFLIWNACILTLMFLQYKHIAETLKLINWRQILM